MRPKVLRIRILPLKDIAIYVPRCGPHRRGPEPKFAITPPVIIRTAAQRRAPITASAQSRRRRCRACEQTRTPAGSLDFRRGARDAMPGPPLRYVEDRGGSTLF